MAIFDWLSSRQQAQQHPLLDQLSLGIGDEQINEILNSYQPSGGGGMDPMVADIFGSEQGSGGEDGMGMTPLGAPSPISNRMDGAFQQDYFNTLFENAQRTQSLYGPDSQIDLSQLPNLQPTLLDEGGYDPATLAQMRARATDDRSQAGITEMAQARRALGMAGLDGSGASAAVMGDVARRTGNATNADMADIDIRNSELAQSNKRSNFQIANEMALTKASQLFGAMSQNAAAGQAKGAAGASVFSQGAGEFGNAAVNRYNNADFQNNANNQRRDEMNFGATEDRWRTGLNALTNFSTPQFPNAPGAAPSFMGSALSGFGSDLLGSGLSNYDWGGSKGSTPDERDGSWG